jgi:hypothetical protein
MSESLTTQIYNIMSSIRSPISEKNLSKRLNVPFRQVNYALKSSDKFEPAAPIEVGSRKQDLTKNHKNIFRLRKVMHIWKLRQ